MKHRPMWEAGSLPPARVSAAGEAWQDWAKIGAVAETATEEKPIAVTPDTHCANCNIRFHSFRDHWESERRDFKGCMMAGCPCTRFTPKAEVDESEMKGWI